MLWGRSRGVGGLAAIAILALLVLQVFSVRDAVGSSDSLEALAIVTRVIDGDTFDAAVIAIYKDRFSSIYGSEIRVRLADINAPELETPEGEAAKAALKSLLEGEEVYLDIDDLYVYDRYGRVVAVAYLPINSTHALNVNLWLVMNGYASIANYPNEFDPSMWSLYIQLPGTAETTRTVTATITTTVVRNTTLPVTTTLTVTVTQKVTTTERIPIPTTVTLITTGSAVTITRTIVVTTSAGGSSDTLSIFLWLVPLALIAMIAIVAALILASRKGIFMLL